MRVPKLCWTSFVYQNHLCVFISDKLLLVDLDGSLIHSDRLYESALKVFRGSSFETLRLPFLLLKGKAFLKQYLASKAEFGPLNASIQRRLSCMAYTTAR